MDIDMYNKSFTNKEYVKGKDKETEYYILIAKLGKRKYELTLLKNHSIIEESCHQGLTEARFHAFECLICYDHSIFKMNKVTMMHYEEDRPEGEHWIKDTKFELRRNLEAYIKSANFSVDIALEPTDIDKAFNKFYEIELTALFLQEQDFSDLIKYIKKYEEAEIFIDLFKQYRNEIRLSDNDTLNLLRTLTNISTPANKFNNVKEMLVGLGKYEELIYEVRKFGFLENNELYKFVKGAISNLVDKASFEKDLGKSLDFEYWWEATRKVSKLDEETECNIEGKVNEVDEEKDAYKVGSLLREVKAPESFDNKGGSGEDRIPKRPIKKDYEKQQKKNLEIGKAGELLVFKYEKQFLLKAGKNDYAENVEHVSETIGDGLGYDIKSFTIEGEVKFIEVKTTTGAINTEFFIEESEVEFSRNNAENYYLIRVFNYDENTGNAEFYIKKGNVEESFQLKPKTYRAK
ncbi:DUF3883 domain-containing protein [Microbacteriaceae bacterium 4G12]